MKIPYMTDIPFRKRTWGDRADQPKRPDLSGRVSLQGLRRLPMRLGLRVSSGHVLISASLNRQTGPLRSSRKDPSPFPLQQQEDCTGFSRKKNFFHELAGDGIRQAEVGACRSPGRAASVDLSGNCTACPVAAKADGWPGARAHGAVPSGGSQGEAAACSLPLRRSCEGR